MAFYEMGLVISPALGKFGALPKEENLMRVAALAAWILVGSVVPSLAQGSGPKTVAILCHCVATSPFLKAFEAGLTEAGWKDGETVRLVKRASDGDPTRLKGQADELVALKPDVIFAGFTPAVVTVQKIATRIPVVFAGVSDPVEMGAAHEIARPDRNLTGMTSINRELMPKRLELLHAALPNLRSVGYLANLNYALHQLQRDEIDASAKRFGMTLVTAEATDVAGIDQAFARFAAERVGAVIVQQDPLFTGQPRRILTLAETNRLPAIYPVRSYFDAGGFMWYGGDVVKQFHDAAAYVGRILRGVKPGELPIERPSKVYLGVNMKLANQMGVQVNPAFLDRADDVIE
jgi:putative ABC transport system substrate-binding protein